MPTTIPSTAPRIADDRPAVAAGVLTAVERILREYVTRPADPADPLAASWLAARLALVAHAIGPTGGEPSVGGTVRRPEADTGRMGKTAIVRAVGRAAGSAAPLAVVVCRRCGLVADGTSPPGWAVGPEAGYGDCPGCRPERPAGPELRASPRWTCELPAVCRVEGAGTDGGPGPDAWPGVVRDLSAGGAGLALGRRFEPGTELRVEVGNGRTTAVEVAGRVVHVRAADGGWVHGVAFARPLTPPEFRALLAFGGSRHD